MRVGCQVAEHSKQETPEDLKALLKDIDDTLAQFDTVCGESLSDEDLDLLETVTAGRYSTFQAFCIDACHQSSWIHALIAAAASCNILS